MKRWIIGALALIAVAAAWFYWDSMAERRKADRIITAIEHYRVTYGHLPNPSDHEVMKSLGFELRAGWYPDYEVGEKGIYLITIPEGFDGPCWIYESLLQTWRKGYPVPSGPKASQATSIPEKAGAAPEAFCGVCRPTRWHPGEVDDQGHLVVFEAGGLSKTLETDYALAFLNTGEEGHPAARFDLSSKESGYETFASLEALTARIQRIPEPRIIDFYGTCGAPPFNGLPEDQIDSFFAAMKEAKVELRTSRSDGGSNVICTCSCPRCK